MESPGTHGIADSSGMALFGFGATGGPIVTPIGQTYSFAFQWAGAYAYDDPFHTKTKGGVSVPISVTRVVGVPETANVVWASGDAPAGFAFDVLIQSPRATGFLPWRTGVTNLSQTFGPSDPAWAGPGRYSFEARLRAVSSGAACGYSKPGSIKLS
jgi:hypothetical protein